MTLTTKSLYAGPGELQKINYLGDLNAMLRGRSYAFRDASGKFDYKKFEEFYKALHPDFEVRIMD